MTVENFLNSVSFSSWRAGARFWNRETQAQSLVINHLFRLYQCNIIYSSETLFPFIISIYHGHEEFCVHSQSSAFKWTILKALKGWNGQKLT